MKGLDDYCMKLFAKELKLVSDLNHKNIVTLFAFCADPVCLFVEYMVFDWKKYGKNYKSHDLAVFLETLDKTNGVDSFHRVAHFTRHIAADVAEGLEHIHRQDIAHRDLKLHNILVSNTVPLPPRQQIRCKITDFGEARAYCVQTNTIAGTGTTRLERGTLSYLAPEVILGSCTIASLGDLKRMDIWAFGMVLLCVLNPDLRHPFSQYLQDQESKHRTDFRAVMLQVMKDEIIPEPSSKYSFLREKYDTVERVRLMCLQYDPSKRPNFSKIIREYVHYYLKLQSYEKMFYGSLMFHRGYPHSSVIHAYCFIFIRLKPAKKRRVSGAGRSVQLASSVTYGNQGVNN